MIELAGIAPRCGVLVGSDGAGQFSHVATAWSVGPGEWVTAWAGEEPPPGDVRLLGSGDGALGAITNWEIENGIAAFISLAAESVLVVARPPAGGESALHKRDELWALGYPDMIDHPAFRLHRGSLTAERYFPYLCPWVLAGHLGLFTAEDGFIAGRFFSGMAGGPVLNAAGQVVGVLLDGEAADGHPPLTRFHRLV